MIKNLRESLIDYDMPLLRAVAESRGVTLAALKQPAAVDELRTLLLEPDSLQWALDRLSERGRTALDAVLAAGGRMKAHVFAANFGETRSFGPGRLERERPWLKPESAAEELWFLGLIFRAITDAGRGYRAQFVYVPSDVAARLPEAPAPATGFVLEPSVAEVAPDSSGVPLTEIVLALLAAVQRRKLIVDADGNLTPDTTQYMLESLAAAGQVDPGDPAAPIRFAARLLRICGLVFPTPGRPHLAWGRASRWLKSPRRRQMILLFKGWREDTGWNELCQIPTLRCEETGWRNDPYVARKTLLELLGRCPPERWLRLDSLVSSVYDLDPDFARPDGDYRSWYIRDSATGQFLMGFESWPQVEGSLIRSIVGGPLRWLSVTELGSETGEQPLASFRITAFGRVVLGGATPADRAEETPARMEVRPNFTVLVPFDARLYDRFQLGRFARFRGAVPGEGWLYAIDRSSLSGAHTQGITLQMILRFLAGRAAEPMPRNVLSALRHWRPPGTTGPQNG